MPLSADLHRQAAGEHGAGAASSIARIQRRLGGTPGELAAVDTQAADAAANGPVQAGEGSPVRERGSITS